MLYKDPFFFFFLSFLNSMGKWRWEGMRQVVFFKGSRNRSRKRLAYEVRALPSEDISS